MMKERHRMSPLTALFLGTTAVIVAGITSLSVIIIYGMNLGDRLSGQLVGIAGKTLEDLPATLEALPDALGDVLEYKRSPGYADQLAVDVRVAKDDAGFVRPVVTVENRGNEVVTLLGIRLVGLDAGGNPVGEWNEYAATPVMIDHDMRGPLLPSRTRVFSTGRRCGHQAVAADVKWEITDVWIWPEHAEAEATQTAAIVGPVQ